MEERIIVLATETVACPRCQHAFPLHEGIARQTIERHHEEFEQQAKAYREQMAADLAKEAERKAAQLFTSKIGELQDQVAAARRSEREAREVIEKARLEAREKAEADVAQRLKAMEEDLGQKARQLQQLRDQELELRRERQALQDLQKNLELELQRKLDEEREKLSQAIAQRESERFQMVEAEYKKRLEAAQHANEELRRKLTQGSQQLQGEVLELHIEQSLASAFFQDVIEEVKKGQRGADVLQSVRTPTGQVAGLIIWEAKRAENWSDKWLEKLKDDQRDANADLAVLVTTAMPRGLHGPFARVGDVWVITPQVLRPMAETLRVILLEVHKLRQAQHGRAEKVEMLYDYLASSAFAQRMRTVFDCFSTMQTELDAERRAFTKIWAKRQKQIDRLVSNMTTVIGELQAIAQESLPELQGIEVLDALTSDSDDAETVAISNGDQ